MSLIKLINMIITKEQQEALLHKYVKERHSTDECIGFIDGIERLMDLITKSMKNESNTNTKIHYSPMCEWEKVTKKVACVQSTIIPDVVMGYGEWHEYLINELKK